MFIEQFAFFLIARPITLWNEISLKVLMFYKLQDGNSFSARMICLGRKIQIEYVCIAMSRLRYNALLRGVLLKMLKIVNDLQYLYPFT